MYNIELVKELKHKAEYYNEIILKELKKETLIIKKELKNKNISYRDISKKTKINKDVVSNILNCKNINFKQLIKIVKVVNN